MTERSNTAPRRAIVIGGSIAGMLAARVLADHFDQVIVIERDRFPTESGPRRGTPQARHLHVLLERGRQILEQLFPGLTDDLISDGASLLDTATDFSILNRAGWAVQFDSGIPMLTCSRDLIDWHVRRRLCENPRIVFEPDADVTGLVPSRSNSVISGVTIRRRNETDNPSAPGSQDLEPNATTSDSSSDVTLLADLVVDASGRRSRLPQWLESLGYGRPAQTVVNPHLGYATRLYRRPARFANGRSGVFVQAAPPTQPRAGVAVPIEGDRLIVTVSGGDGDYPPTDAHGFLEFVRSLRSPVLYETIKECEPLSPVYAFRGLDNRQRHYDRMSRWPERLIVLGDAACAFNPVYAQGIATAALSALQLDRCLRACRVGNTLRHGFARRFQKRLARVGRAPWLLATGEDLRYRTTEGGRSSRFTRFTHRYIDHLSRLITQNTTVRRRSLRVFHLLSHPASLYHPGNVARVVVAITRDWFTQRARGIREASLSLFRGHTGVELPLAPRAPQN